MNRRDLLALGPAVVLGMTLHSGATAENETKVPGIIVDHSPESSRAYIGSPGLAVLANGEYVASHDFFGPGTTNNRTVVFASANHGKSWTKRTELEGQWWSSLFTHRGALYLMGTSKEYGFAVIRRSSDGGRTWTTPDNARTGLLVGDGKYHCAPVPVVVHAGRIWRAMEDAMGPGGWGSHFRAFTMSAPEDADLLVASNWTSTNHLGRDAAWLDGKFGGWLEGNAVVTPEGGIVDILRVDFQPEGGKAAWVEISPDGKTARFDPVNGFFDMPGGGKKFTIRHDPQGGYYWSLTNYVPAKHRGGTDGKTRNTVALIRSRDLRKWEVRATVLYHPDPLHHGFQYLDWQFEGEDLIALCRTAYDDGLGGAHNQHDANYLTFHRVPRFRTLVGPDPA